MDVESILFGKEVRISEISEILNKRAAAAGLASAQEDITILSESRIVSTVID